MQIRRIGYRVKGFLRVADRALYWSMICKTAEQRYKVLCFWEKHGLAATQEAFGVSRRSLYAWRAQLRAGGGQPHAVAPGSTRPKQVRQRRWPLPVIEEIRRLRQAHPNLGKEKLHPFVQQFCVEQRLEYPSTRTPRERKPKGYRAGLPGDCLAWDSIERRRDGLRRYLITCTDLKSRFAFALGLPTLSSAHAKTALDLAQIVFPLPMQRVLSDNGKEFAKHFHQSVRNQGLTHWHTYPRTPKMNAHAERFNRTLQEELVDYHEDQLFGDLPAFNDTLFDWLYWYNAQRPHHSLGLKTPLDILAAHLGNECRMYWPNTLTPCRKHGCL